MKRIAVALLLVPLAYLLLTGCVGLPANATIKYGAVAASRIDDDGKAVDNIQGIDMSNGQVYLQTSWHGLEPRPFPYRYRLELYDGKGYLVYTANDSFSSGPEGYETTSWYSFRPVDSPGFWKFKLYLNGSFIAEKPLLVTANERKGVFPDGQGEREF